MNIKSILINNLRFYRKDKKLTQSQFAEMINVSTNYYNAIENGKYFPSLDVLNVICIQLDIRPYQLFMENPQHLAKNEINNTKLLQLKKEMNSIIESYII